MSKNCDLTWVTCSFSTQNDLNGLHDCSFLEKGGVSGQQLFCGDIDKGETCGSSNQNNYTNIQSVQMFILVSSSKQH